MALPLNAISINYNDRLEWILEFQFTYKKPSDAHPPGIQCCKIGFGTPGPAVANEVFCVETFLPHIPSALLLTEFIEFNAAAKATTGEQGQIRYVRTQDWILVQLNLSYTRASLADTTYQAYVDLFSCVQSQGFPYFARMWNYLADINQGDGDAEAYKQFCSGRARAFTHMGMGAAQYPAASALGRHTHGLQVYALATITPCTHVENPVQTSAYHYPREYGPASPSFARATLAGQNSEILFISGTASILNAQSCFLGDLVKQAELSCQNILRVMQQAQQISQCSYQLQLAKVYLRNAHDYPLAASIVKALLGPNCQTVWLQADICRTELLIEIEGIGVRDEGPALG